MTTGWENVEPAPIEFFHGKLLELFHQWRNAQISDISIDATTLNNIIAKAKIETYNKYPKQNLQKPIPKSEM